MKSREAYKGVVQERLVHALMDLLLVQSFTP